MADVVCDGCGEQVPPSDTYFGSLGTVCSQCHQHEAAYDAWRFQRDAGERGPLTKEARAFIHARRGKEAAERAALRAAQQAAADAPPVELPSLEDGRCPKCWDEMGDAGSYYASDGSGLVCVNCAFS